MEMRMNIYRLSAKLFFYYKKLDNILKIFKIDKDRKIHKIDNFDFKKLLSGFNIEYGSNIFIHAGLKKIIKFQVKVIMILWMKLFIF
jgi:hypothetical protein